MASMQCHKPATNEACPKTSQNMPASESSLGQKVSGFLKGHHGSHSSSHTQRSATATNGQGHHATNGTACHGRTKKKGEHRNKKTGGGRNLLQKIKDGISGHSSSSSDSSDGESDKEGSCRKKASD
ncbi:hypothetical protein ACFX13_015137 [Malus domestica]|uniref:Uncharacterized protein n=1 Tax=Malus domestica TaxID=3750 RepID=A0A498I823_MALDO|nr:hypothetical protein DVH24_040098 [Malus domestica]